jgi:hypothetical protein
MIQTELFSTDNCSGECRGNNFAICHTEYPFSADWAFVRRSRAGRKY